MGSKKNLEKITHKKNVGTRTKKYFPRKKIFFSIEIFSRSSAWPQGGYCAQITFEKNVQAWKNSKKCLRKF